MRKRFSQIRLKTLQFSFGVINQNENVCPSGHAKNNLFELQLKGIMADGDGFEEFVISPVFVCNYYHSFVVSYLREDGI